jgi:hypothetical protein
MVEARAFLLGLRSQGLLAQAVAAAAAIGVAERLAGGPRPVAALAAELGVDADSLYRLLRTLAGHGVFAQTETGEFTLTETAELLRPNAEGSLYRLLGGEFSRLVTDAYQQLAGAVREGEVAFERTHGAPFFDYLAAHPTANADFDATMAMVADAEHPVIAAHFDFSRFPVIADIGGGHGGLLAAVLERFPKARGVLFDQPQVLDADKLQGSAVAERCAVAGGDFFDAVPGDADLYILKRILHDWDDADAVRILRTVRAAMGEEARLAVIDAVMKPGNDSDPNKDLDLNMMVLTGGRERTEEEFRGLFAASGLELLAVHELPDPVTLSIVEAGPG